MKLKGKYLALIVAVMLVLTAVVASLIVSSVQGSRIAYIAVSADKESYSAGENVTFELRPLSQGIEFTIGGGYYDPYGYYRGESMNIIRIPDHLDPYSLIDDTSVMESMYQWRYWDSASVPMPAFTSTGDPLSMTWNGTIRSHTDAFEENSWGQATAGYYVLYPSSDSGYYPYPSGSDRTVRFFLDRSSIFHYGGPEIDYELKAAAPGTDIAISITLPAGASPAQGELSVYLPTWIPSEGPPSLFHNRTVDLEPGGTATVNITFLTPYPDFNLDAVLVVGDDVYIFGFWQRSTWNDAGGSTLVLIKY